MNEIDINAMDLNLLKVFEALYDEGSASRAALRLGLTQSAVSAALVRLRNVYRDPLFERRGRGMVPTARAHELNTTVREVLLLCRATLHSSRSGSMSFHGRKISLGLSDDLEIAIGRSLAERLWRLAPGLRLVLHQTNSAQATEMLTSRKADLVLVAGGFGARSISRQQVMVGGYACVIPLSAGDEHPLTLDDFLGREHLLISSGGYLGIVDETLLAMGLRRTVSISTTHFAAVPFLLGRGNMVATMPRHAARAVAEMGPLALRACPLTMPDYTIELGWRPDTLRDPAVQVVKDAILAVFAEMGGP